jgi:hypothetical protein
MDMRRPRLPAITVRQIVLFFIPIVLLLFLLGVGFGIEGSQQFSELAQGFLHGHLYFLQSIGGEGQDPVFYNGHIFWSEGPFPAVLLMPFVAIFSIFHIFFYQGYLKWILVLAVLFFVFKIARKLKYSSEDSLILAFAFILASVFIGVASVSSGWLFAQVVQAFLVLWALYEYYHHKRWWLIGILCGLTFLTRATAAPVIIFFALELWQTVPRPARRNQLELLVGPLVVAILLQGLYNTYRFHDPLNGGYEYQLLGPAPATSRALGVFSPIHIPANLYALIFAGPVTVLRDQSSWTLKFPYIQSNPDGLSIFITSPYLLYLFGQKWSVFDKTARNLLIAAAISCLGVLCFYGLGRDQLGDRYSLDFFPELFVVFMIIYRKHHTQITRGMKCLLLVSGLLNFYLLLSYIAW